MGYRLVADIGGTKIAASLLTSGGKTISQSVEQTITSDGELLFDSFIQICEELYMKAGLSRSEINGISVGLPGIIDHENGIAVFQNNLPWHGFPIKERLAELYPAAQIEIDNDVHMAAWGEYSRRSFTKETFVYMTLSTGISCAVISEGRMVRGAGMAGEIGFVPIGDKTLEETVSGPALEEKGRGIFEDEELSLKDVMELYYKGDQNASAIISGAVQALANEVHHMILLLDPHAIVLGGGVFNNHSPLIEEVKKEVASRLQHPLLKGKEQRIEGSCHKGEAGLWGAFHLLDKRPHQPIENETV